MRHKLYTTHLNDWWTPEAMARRGDCAFQAAMKAAIAGGLEHAPLGTVGADPDVRTSIRFVPAGCAISLTGSPAAMCDDLGETRNF